jgi:hypothetical protein
MQWGKLSREKNRVFVELKKQITHQNYGDSTKDPDKWCITELIKERNAAKFVALEILEGRNQKGILFQDQAVKGPDGLQMTFKLEVLSRQACYEDKSGHKIFVHPDAINNVGSPDDIVVINPDEPPKPGDIIRIKTRPKDLDENGEEVTLKIRNMWVAYGDDEYFYANFKVQDDLTINVPYPHVKTFLERAGFRIAFPQFSKGHRPRRVTQWLYKEVFPGDAQPEEKPIRKRRTRKPKEENNEPENTPDKSSTLDGG